jgi:hypothetical protein
MDANKLKVLKDLPYVIRATCQTCVSANFPKDERLEFGTCGKHLYEHQKHAGEPRELSIHRYGVCPHWSENRVATVKLGGYGQFLEEP